MKAIDFGFLFCRVMHFYQLSDGEVLALPIRRFWLLSDNINRIRAEQDNRNINLAMCASDAGGKMAEELRKHLVVEQGTIFIEESQRDTDADRKLRALANIK